MSNLGKKIKVRKKSKLSGAERGSLLQKPNQVDRVTIMPVLKGKNINSNPYNHSINMFIPTEFR